MKKGSSYNPDLNKGYLQALLEDWLAQFFVKLLLPTILCCDVVKGKKLLFVIGFHDYGVFLAVAERYRAPLVLVVGCDGAYSDQDFDGLLDCLAHSFRLLHSI